MKKISLLYVVAIAAVSCTAPKYTYKFDYHDYNAGRKERMAAREVASNAGPVAIQPEALIAEASTSSTTESTVQTSSTESTPLTLSRAERRQIVKNLKAAAKEISKRNKGKDTVDTDHTTKAMDPDLKLSVIFLVVAIAAGLFVSLSSLFWIMSVAAFVVAVYFFIKWVMKQ